MAVTLTNIVSERSQNKTVHSMWFYFKFKTGKINLQCQKLKVIQLVIVGEGSYGRVAYKRLLGC